MLKKIESFFEKYNISIEGKKICVCFSGGADSVALLEAMCDINRKLPFFLCAVHVNHHIRGAEAESDEQFCKAFCEKRNVPFYSFGVYAVEEAEKTGCSLEAAARKLRYEAFEMLKERENIDYFLTAHHGNDWAETVVFNMVRGCSVSGLCGIPHVRDFYLRPLIYCSKEEILEYVTREGSAYVEDSTNSDEAYTRNYIRRSLLPSFERINSNYLSAILRLSESAVQDEDYFREQLDKITSETDLSSLHPSVSSRYVCREYEKVSSGEGLSAVHVRQILSCLRSSEEKCVNLPFMINAYVKNGRVVFRKEAGKECEKLFLNFGENVFGEGILIKLDRRFEKILKFSDCPLKIVLPKEKIKGTLFARKRAEGDRIFCRGFGRSVSKELMNAKVPKYMRSSLPIICDDEGIVFVPFVGADDRVFQKGYINDPIMITVYIDFN